ncbi:MAG: hypothetical protein HYU36_07690 [Planctomycetes bacterium]|nr:hypothetical protein [Planctomycetota bacterium]
MPSPFQQLLLELESLRISDVPLVDWHYKISLLAVIMNEKPASAIGFDEPTPPKYIQFLDQRAPLLRLFLKETRRPPRDYLNEARISPQVARTVAERWDRSPKSSDCVLWIYKHSAQEDAIEGAARGDLPVHVPLGYPACCGNAYRADRAAAVEEYVRKLSDSTNARSEEELVRHIRESVPVSGPLPGGERALQTVSRFPFLPYIACPACLSRERSEAALQNARFRQILAALSPLAARKVLLLARTVTARRSASDP